MCILQACSEGQIAVNDKFLQLMTSVTVDDCAVTGLPKDIESFFMTGLEGQFKIKTRGGLLKKHLGVDYDWGALPNGKVYWRATMDKKIHVLVEAFEKHVRREVKLYDTPGKPHEYLTKSIEVDPMDIDQYRSFVGLLIDVCDDEDYSENQNCCSESTIRLHV